MDEFERAGSKRSDGEYREACDRYLQAAVSELIDRGYDPLGDGGFTIGILMNALCAATLATDSNRVDVVKSVLKSLLEVTLESSGRDDEAVAGVCVEWVGDAELVSGTDDAQGYYDQAEDYFASADKRAADRWSMEKGLDYSAAAICRWVETIGADIDRGRFTATDYADRLEYKRELARHLELRD